MNNPVGTRRGDGALRPHETAFVFASFGVNLSDSVTVASRRRLPMHMLCTTLWTGRGIVRGQLVIPSALHNPVQPSPVAALVVHDRATHPHQRTWQSIHTVHTAYYCYCFISSRTLLLSNPGENLVRRPPDRSGLPERKRAAGTAGTDRSPTPIVGKGPGRRTLGRPLPCEAPDDNHRPRFTVSARRRVPNARPYRPICAEQRPWRSSR